MTGVQTCALPIYISSAAQIAGFFTKSHSTSCFSELVSKLSMVTFSHPKLERGCKDIAQLDHNPCIGPAHKSKDYMSCLIIVQLIVDSSFLKHYCNHVIRSVKLGNIVLQIPIVNTSSIQNSLANSLSCMLLDVFRIL